MAIDWLVTEPTASNKPGERHRRRHLVADVAGVVQVQPAVEHGLHEAGELGREVGPRRIRRGGVGTRQIRLMGSVRPAPLAGLWTPGAARSSAAASRTPSGGSTQGSTGPSERSTRARWAASEFGQPMAGIFQQKRVVGSGDPFGGPRRVRLGWWTWWWRFRGSVYGRVIVRCFVGVCNARSER